MLFDFLAGYCLGYAVAHFWPVQFAALVSALWAKVKALLGQ